MKMREQRLVINLDLVAAREPFAFAGIASVPEECRRLVLREMLEAGIAAQHVPGQVTRAPDECPTGEDKIFKKLTFYAARTEDALLYEYFDRVSPGRRKSTARALLAKGLMVRAKGQPTPQPHVVPERAVPRSKPSAPAARPAPQSRAPDSFDVPDDLFAAVSVK